MNTILKTHKLGEPKYVVGFYEVPMGVAVALSSSIFGAHTVDSDEELSAILADFPEYEFEVSQAEFGMSDNLA